MILLDKNYIAYSIIYASIARMCMEGSILMKQGTFSASNNGEQWAEAEEANAHLD